MKYENMNQLKRRRGVSDRKHLRLVEHAHLEFRVSLKRNSLTFLVYFSNKLFLNLNLTFIRAAGVSGYEFLHLSDSDFSFRCRC